MSNQPDWLHQAKVFWDETGRERAAPTWPPKEVKPRAPQRVIIPDVKPEPMSKTVEGEPPDPLRQLPRELILYYVNDPKTDERWVPMSPTVVKALTEFATAQGMRFDWRIMDASASAQQAMRR